MAKPKNFKLLRFFVFVIGLVFVISPFFVQVKSQNKSYAYTMANHEYESIDFTYNVQENNSINVTQVMQVRFLTDGLTELLWTFPYCGTKKLGSGEVTETQNYMLSITNYSLTKGQEGSEYLKYYVDDFDGYLSLGIKNPNGYEVGRTYTYTLKYTYNFYEEQLKGKDAIYFNIINSDNDADIAALSLTINLPKDVDFATRTPYLYYGSTGSKTTLTNYQTESRKVYTTSVISVSANRALTFYLEVPAGYITEKPIDYTWPIIALVIGIIIAAYIVINKLKNAQIKEVVTPVTITPPEKITPIMAEYINNYNITDKSFGATIVYLASKGYVHLVLAGDEEHTPVAIKKVKDYPQGVNRKLENFFYSFFKNGDEVTLKELEKGSIETYNNYTTYKEKTKLEMQENMFVESNKKALKINNWLIFISIAISFICFMFSFKANLGFIPSAIGGVPFVVMFIVPIIILQNTNRSIPLKIFFEGIIIVILFAMFVGAMGPLSLCDKFMLVPISMIIITLTSIIPKYPKLNASAAKDRGEVLGLKKFIKAVEEKRLDELVTMNPSIYYDILPYAYVLGVNNVWIKKFERIPLNVPVWIDNFNSTTMFDIWVINRSINSLNRASTRGLMAQRIATSSSSGGGFGGGGGGGFSGGGGGGGGSHAR